MGAAMPRELAEKAEEVALSEYAAKSYDRKRCARRLYRQEPDYCRTEFQRDYTRIIHSTAFRRLRNKTQVFISPKNDHVCTRMEHSIHVASVARTIARALRLNVDLVDAIAVGHDLGHGPFGHKGEQCLGVLAKEFKLSYRHETQSLRVVDFLESPYFETGKHMGLNLTFAVRDGIVCHCGEASQGGGLCPDLDRDDIPQDLQPDTLMPATLEGCVVRLADSVAYLGRDLEDAIATGIVCATDLPQNVRKTLGDDNRSIIRSLVQDIVANNQNEPCIALSNEVIAGLAEFREFSKKRIYEDLRVQRPWRQIERSLTNMFEFLSTELRKGSLKSACPKDNEPGVIGVLREFLWHDLHGQVDGAKHPEQVALDFIGGMTDAYFIRSYRELFLPESTA